MIGVHVRVGEPLVCLCTGHPSLESPLCISHFQSCAFSTRWTPGRMTPHDTSFVKSWFLPRRIGNLYFCSSFQLVSVSVIALIILYWKLSVFFLLGVLWEQGLCSVYSLPSCARHRAVPTNGYKEDEVRAGQSHGSLSGGYAQQWDTICLL